MKALEDCVPGNDQPVPVRGVCAQMNMLSKAEVVCVLMLQSLLSPVMLTELLSLVGSPIEKKPQEDDGKISWGA